MDGVLLDSETIYKSSNAKLFQSLGLSIDEHQYQSLIGLSSTKIWETLISESGLSGNIEEYKQLEKETKYQALFESELIPHQHIFDLLYYCKKSNIKMGIASMSSRKNIDLIISKLKMNLFFEVILSGENVTLGKPNPEIYLKAAEKLNLKPNQCLVIEDSFNGSQAAAAAGMKCIGYINAGSGKQDLSSCIMTSNNYKEVLKYILQNHFID